MTEGSKESLAPEEEASIREVLIEKGIITPDDPDPAILVVSSDRVLENVMAIHDMEPKGETEEARQTLAARSAVADTEAVDAYVDMLKNMSPQEREERTEAYGVVRDIAKLEGLDTKVVVVASREGSMQVLEGEG